LKEKPKKYYPQMNANGRKYKKIKEYCHSGMLLAGMAIYNYLASFALFAG